MSTFSDRLKLILTPVSESTKSFITWRTELAGDTDSNMTKIDSAIADLQDGKQEAIPGTQGQVVGFDANGNAIAQDAPSGLPEGTNGQIIQYDADGNAQAVDAPFLPLDGGTVTGTIMFSNSSESAGILINGFDNEGVYIATDYLDTCNGYVDGKPVLSFTGSISDEPTILRCIESPIQPGDAANKQYVDAQKPKLLTVTLSASAWDSSALTQTVTVSGVLADETAQLIQPTPAIASQSSYYDAGIKCTGQAADSLTFTADTVPTEDLTVYVVIQEVTA